MPEQELRRYGVCSREINAFLLTSMILSAPVGALSYFFTPSNIEVFVIIPDVDCHVGKRFSIGEMPGREPTAF
jgi:hypothetical protein